MGIYNTYVLPKMINFACSQSSTMKQREKIIPLVEGRVLEIGVGTGLNIPFYNASKVDYVMGIDPEVANWKEGKIDVAKLPFEYEFVEAFAEDIPADNHSFDSVVITYTLCSIPEVALAFDEIRRVMKPNGKLYFCEHGKAPDKVVQKWQNSINPMWKRIGGGCHLNRDIPSLILESGFKIQELEEMYIPGWKPLSYNYWGSAKVD
ncbi:MAG: ubiquinone/menaquinone biosynthesis C-methylase UbiE [Saprospiraceae bacterium]|jgi:ubiquinone/menaquinone biosynthesis C-methylase UbiE